MPSFSRIVAFGLGLAAYSQAYGIPAPAERSFKFAARQEPAAAASSAPAAAVPGSASTAPASAPAAAAPAASATLAPMAAGGGITDIDILQFALTLEHLESTFYTQGFQKFPDSDFAALGLQQSQITALKQVAATEATHVTTLMGAIAQAGQQPVQACKYNFNLPDAKTMVATARVLEAVGVSAYLGAAPLVNSSNVLGVAASIVTVESRHQTFIRGASAAVPVPAAFDTALGVKSVFTLAAPFIASCPQGSNLNLQANPQIALQTPMVTAGQMLVLQNPAQPAGAMFCSFINQGMTQFAPLTSGQCQVPSNMAGEVYMLVTKSQSVADTEVLAGPSVIEMS